MLPSTPTDNYILLILKVTAIQKYKNCQLCILWENSSVYLVDFVQSDAHDKEPQSTIKSLQ